MFEKKHWIDLKFRLWNLVRTTIIPKKSMVKKLMFRRAISYGLWELFYKFIKARKQCIFNWKISQNICLCETCENAVLLVRSLNQACKELKPCDPHAIVKEYSCNSKKKDCMLSICEGCKSHGFEQNWTTSTKKRLNRRKWWW